MRKDARTQSLEPAATEPDPDPDPPPEDRFTEYPLLLTQALAQVETAVGLCAGRPCARRHIGEAVDRLRGWQGAANARLTLLSDISDHRIGTAEHLKEAALAIRAERECNPAPGERGQGVALAIAHLQLTLAADDAAAVQALDNPANEEM